MKKIFLGLAIVLMAQVSFAQQTLTSNLYGLNKSALNHASSLMQSEGEVSLLGRWQWVGMEGAPTVYWANAHVGLDALKATVGVSVRHESVGVEKHTDASVYFAKSVRLSENDYLGFSLSAGLLNYEARFSSLSSSDPSFRDDTKITEGTVGLGAVYFRPEKFYVGISMPKILLNLDDDLSPEQYNFGNQLHAMAGMLLPIGEEFHIKPAVLVNFTKDQETLADISAMFYMQKTIGVGVNVRTNGDIAPMAQFNYQGIGIGYAYQVNGSSGISNRVTNSTHEVGLTYRFGRSEHKNIL